jgi:hypothetical protein
MGLHAAELRLGRLLGASANLLVLSRPAAWLTSALKRRPE